jgi:hypothetical protein
LRLPSFLSLRLIRVAQIPGVKLINWTMQRTLTGILKVQTDIAKEKEHPVKYNSCKLDHNRAVFTLLEPPEENFVGQKGLITSEKYVLLIGEVDDVRTDLRPPRPTSAEELQSLLHQPGAI